MRAAPDGKGAFAVLYFDVPKPLRHGCGITGFVMKSVLSDKHFHNEGAADKFEEVFKKLVPPKISPR